MSKHKNMKKILITKRLAAMRPLSIAAACLLLASLSAGECLTVTGTGPGVTTFHLSSRRIRITTLQEGKTLENVRVLFYLTTDDVNPKLALTTDKHGVALGSDLAPGRYRILAFGPEQESAGMYLEVKDKGGSRTSSFLLNIPPAFSARESIGH